MISFSPVYFSPEWASFVVDARGSIEVCPSLDAWSLGTTLAELVILQPMLSKQFLKQRRNVGRFLKWLGGCTSVPVPQEIRNFDPELSYLLSEMLLVEGPKRKPLAQVLQHPFLKQQPTSPTASTVSSAGENFFADVAIDIEAANKDFVLQPAVLNACSPLKSRVSDGTELMSPWAEGLDDLENMPPSAFASPWLTPPRSVLPRRLCSPEVKRLRPPQVVASLQPWHWTEVAAN